MLPFEPNRERCNEAHRTRRSWCRAAFSSYSMSAVSNKEDIEKQMRYVLHREGSIFLSEKRPTLRRPCRAWIWKFRYSFQPDSSHAWCRLVFFDHLDDRVHDLLNESSLINRTFWPSFVESFVQNGILITNLKLFRLDWKYPAFS